jgi:hypothetical protein
MIGDVKNAARITGVHRRTIARWIAEQRPMVAWRCYCAGEYGVPVAAEVCPRCHSERPIR